MLQASQKHPESEKETARPEKETSKPEKDAPPPGPSPKVNGTHSRAASSAAPAKPKTQETDAPSDTSERLEALAKERDTLRAEVTELRKSLENIQSKHEEETAKIKSELENSQSGKEHAESQYRDLRGKVQLIRSQLGERMKSDAEELEKTRAQIDDLEERNRSYREANETLSEDLNKLRGEMEQQNSEIHNLRSRANQSQQNWINERDELIQREAYAREEYETAKQAMQDWEVLAIEERSLRENLSDRVAGLEDQLNSQREALERAQSERDTQTSTVDGLQRALRDIQDARKKELRELVENSQSQLESLRKQLQDAESASATARATLETTQKELERALPFEKEVKEKNLLIGKLRHEAVILNDHLTKALRILKKGRPEDNVDRQIVTNHFLQFLALERGDPKKFQVLQLIAALLGWNDEQREQAGLARPGSTSTSGSLKIPLSPFRRTPSTPSLNTDLLLDTSGNKESLAELWQDFLEKEALEGSRAGSRRGSTATTTTPTVASPNVSRKESRDAGRGGGGEAGKGLGIM
ncbi:hypothetical protein K490DRAFT_45564 [Saccharata proteae CBS 121410]|uniref:GRIP domain-containing protein n=1 Tax=Saccharata proteae CBS 121410 TaxID=1314787 RepID=A0A9P4HT52_9PEZI|nr:hypothetical protein K490DRAFT_45564 [Saccharata proteae CBS 121410]